MACFYKICHNGDLSLDHARRALLVRTRGKGRLNPVHGGTTGTVFTRCRNLGLRVSCKEPFYSGFRPVITANIRFL